MVIYIDSDDEENYGEFLFFFEIRWHNDRY